MRAVLTQLSQIEPGHSLVESSEIGQTGFVRSSRTARGFRSQTQLFWSEASQTAWVMFRLAALNE